MKCQIAIMLFKIRYTVFVSFSVFRQMAAELIGLQVTNGRLYNRASLILASGRQML